MQNRIYKALLVLAGLLLTAAGTRLLTVNHLTFGGTAGIATLLSFKTSFSWGWLFFLVNLPFFILSIKRLGWMFSLSTLLCIVLISIVSDLFKLLSFPQMPPLATGVLAGTLIGIGVSLVFNQGSSLGGIHIFALYLEQFANINRGITLFATDFLIVGSASFVVGAEKAAYSIPAIAIAGFLAGKLKKKAPSADLKDEFENSVNAT